MINKNKYKNIEWIDLENPTNEEVRAIMDQYDIDPIIGNELLSPTLRPRVDAHSKYIYLILHFPVSPEKDRKEISDKGEKKLSKTQQKIQEVDFIIGKNFIITTHYDSVDAMYDFSKIFEVNSILSKNQIGNHAGYMFFFMIKYLYQILYNKVENLAEKLSQFEEEIFAGNEKEMVVELSKLKRTLLTFKEATAAHKEVLVTFEIAAEGFFGSDFKYYLRSILGEYYKVRTFIESTKEHLDEMRETNNSLLTTKQNEVIQKLTVITFIILPLSFISSLFGMNTANTPFVGQPLDFFIILSIVSGIGIIVFTFCKEKGWI